MQTDSMSRAVETFSGGEEHRESELQEVEVVLSVDSARTAVLTPAEQEALARKIAHMRARILAVLRRRKKLCQAALNHLGGAVILSEEHFREREARTVLRFAQRALLDRETFSPTRLRKRGRLEEFVWDLERWLEGYRALRDGMMRANLHLVNLAVRRYCQRVFGVVDFSRTPTRPQGPVPDRYGGVTFLDLLRHGAVGLLRAIETYDPRTKVKFETYASCYIRQQLSDVADLQSPVTRRPVRRNQSRGRVGRRARELAVPLELALSEQAPGPEEIVERSCVRERLEEALKKLPAREGHILRVRFGLDDGEPWSVEDLGRFYGVSRERIRQLEARGLKMLRAICAEQGLQDYLQ